MAKLISIFWRDIPSQVVGSRGRVRFKQLLPARFQEGIDRAAMRAGRGSSDAYLADWHRETEIVEGDIEALVKARAHELEQRFGDEALERLVKAKGLLGGEKQ